MALDLVYKKKDFRWEWKLAAAIWLYSRIMYTVVDDGSAFGLKIRGLSVRNPVHGRIEFESSEV